MEKKMNKIIEYQTDIQCIDICKSAKTGCPESVNQDDMFVQISLQIINEKGEIISEYGHCMECETPVAYHNDYSGEWESGDEAEFIFDKYYRDDSFEREGMEVCSWCAEWTRSVATTCDKCNRKL